MSHFVTEVADTPSGIVRSLVAIAQSAGTPIEGAIIFTRLPDGRLVGLAALAQHTPWAEARAAATEALR